MTDNKALLNSILEKLDTISYIKSDSIPNIDLYMDQVTGFMDDHLDNFKRYDEDKALTKTMINNYTKNHLLPAPDKKKYNKEHMLLLIFIYYYKNILSFSDIEAIFKPLTDKHFKNTKNLLSLADIYDEVFSLEQAGMDNLKKDLIHKYDTAMETFTDANEEDRNYLTLFTFVCELAFDVYLKKQMIEQISDTLIKSAPPVKSKKANKEK